MKNSMIGRFMKDRDLSLLFMSISDYIPDSVFIYDRFYMFYDKDVDYTSQKKLEEGMDLAIQVVTDDLLEKVQHDLDVDLKIIRFQLEKATIPAEIMTIEKDGRYIGVTFFKENDVAWSPSGYTFSLGEDIKFLWIFGTFVHPDYRIKGFNSIFLHQANALRVERGLDYLMGELHYGNKLTLKAHIKMGLKMYRDIHYLKLMNKKIFWENKTNFEQLKEKHLKSRLT